MALADIQQNIDNLTQRMDDSDTSLQDFSDNVSQNLDNVQTNIDDLTQTQGQLTFPLSQDSMDLIDQEVQSSNSIAAIKAAISSTVTLGTSGAVAFDPTSASVFLVTPTAAVQYTPSLFPAGQIIVFRILSSGLVSYTITFSTGFVANGTFTTDALGGRYYTVTFACDGTYWVELSRTIAMLPS